MVWHDALKQFTWRNPQYANRPLFITHFLFHLIPGIFCFARRSLHHPPTTHFFSTTVFIKYLIEHAYLTTIMAIICGENCLLESWTKKNIKLRVCVYYLSFVSYFGLVYRIRIVNQTICSMRQSPEYFDTTCFNFSILLLLNVMLIRNDQVVNLN